MEQLTPEARRAIDLASRLMETRGCGEEEATARVDKDHENVVGTEVMAEYLQQTIERLAQEWAKERGLNVFCKDAIAVREGMADRITERLSDLQKAQAAEDEKRKAEEAARARHPAYVSSGTSLVLADVRQTEADLNEDHLRGVPLGTTANERAAREARQAVFDRKYDLYIRRDRETFTLEFGEEEASNFYDYRVREKERRDAKAAQEAAEAQEMLAKRDRRKETMIANGTWREPKKRKEPTSTRKEWEPRSQTYYAGRRMGEDIGLDKQIDETVKRRLK